MNPHLNTQSSFQCLHLHGGLVEAPPRLPIPGDDEANAPVPSNPGLSSGKSSAYHPLPLYMGKTFTAICGLWSIAHTIIWAYYDGANSGSPSQRAHLDTAERCFQELLSWADKLPLELVRGDAMSHHATLIQYVYSLGRRLETFFCMFRRWMSVSDTSC